MDVRSIHMKRRCSVFCRSRHQIQPLRCWTRSEWIALPWPRAGATHESEAPDWGTRVTAVVKAESLTKRFGAVSAVSDLSFVLEAGTITGFLGLNGAGKTTTLRTPLGWRYRQADVRWCSIVLTLIWRTCDADRCRS